MAVPESEMYRTTQMVYSITLTSRENIDVVGTETGTERRSRETGTERSSRETGQRLTSCCVLHVLGR